jgi:Arc/MetJ-type ribon-helix-helix transcriptional regulator
MTKEGNYQVQTNLRVRVPEGDIERIKQLIPKHYANESDFLRAAVRQTLEKKEKELKERAERGI